MSADGLMREIRKRLPLKLGVTSGAVLDLTVAFKVAWPREAVVRDEAFVVGIVPMCVPLVVVNVLLTIAVPVSIGLLMRFVILMLVCMVRSSGCSCVQIMSGIYLDVSALPFSGSASLLWLVPVCVLLRLLPLDGVQLRTDVSIPPGCLASFKDPDAVRSFEEVERQSHGLGSDTSPSNLHRLLRSRQVCMTLLDCFHITHARCGSWCSCSCSIRICSCFAIANSVAGVCSPVIAPSLGIRGRSS